MSFSNLKIPFSFQKTFSVSMSTCRRLHYVSKVCLRLLRKYTNEIYPNDLPKIEKPQPKRSTPDADDKNEPQLCKNLVNSVTVFKFLKVNEKNIFFRCRCVESTGRTIVDEAKTFIETSDVEQFGCNNISEYEKDSSGEFTVGRMHRRRACTAHRHSVR